PEQLSCKGAPCERLYLVPVRYGGTGCRRCISAHSALPDAHSRTYSPRSTSPRYCDLRCECCRTTSPLLGALPDEADRRSPDRSSVMGSWHRDFADSATGRQNSWSVLRNVGGSAFGGPAVSV